MALLAKGRELLSVKLSKFSSNFLILTKAYLEPCETSMMELFREIASSFWPLTIFVEKPHRRWLQGPKYTSASTQDIIKKNSTFLFFSSFNYEVRYTM